jgi:uncharacterized damage-inducible protein DinB
MNPYVSFLGNRDPLRVIGETPARLTSLISSLSKEQLDLSPAPGKWSVRQILCHLADTEVAFAFRWRQALAEPHHVIQPFDQDRWAAFYSAFSADDALHTFAVMRDWNLKLITSLPAESMAKPVMHPERGAMTLRTVLETMAGHDLNHMLQIEAASS